MVTLGDHAAPVVTAVRADPPRPGPARPDLDLPAEAPPPPPPDASPAPVAAVPLPSRVAQGADPGDETARAAGPAAAPAMAEVPQAPLRPRTDPAPLAGPTAAPPVARSPVMAEAPPVPMPRPAEETGALAPLPPRPAPRAGLPEAPPTPDPAPGLAALRVPAAPGATPRLTAPAAGPEAPARDPAMAAPAMTVAGLRPARPDPARPAPPAAPDSAPPAAVAAVPPGPGPEPASRAPLVLSPGSGDAPARPVTAVLPERIPLAGPVAMAPAPESAPRPAPAAARPDSGMPMPAVPAEPVAETPLPALPPASIPPRSRTVAAPAAETPSRPPAADVVPAAAPVRDCPVALSMTPGPQQMLAVRLEAPCRSGEAVTLLHAGLKATVLLDSAGVARIDLPAMADPAKVETLFGDAAGPTASAAVPDLDRVARVALVWTGPADLDLHAFAPGTAGHVWEGAPGDPRAARRDGGAWMTTLGDPVAGGFRTEIISVPLGRRTPAAVLRLELGLAPGSACPEHVDYVAVWADERRRTEERSIRLPLGNCAAAPFVTNTGLRDLVLSRR